MSKLNGREVVYEFQVGWEILCVDFPRMGFTSFCPLWGFPDVLWHQMNNGEGNLASPGEASCHYSEAKDSQ